MTTDTPRPAPAAQPAPAAKPRLVQYDLVRAVAMTWVIIEHSLQVIDWGEPGRIWYAALESVVLTCNVVFFALSGKFNLGVSASRDPRRFYLKRIVSVVLPTALFFFVRGLYDMRGDYGSVANVLSLFVSNSLGGLGKSEYWFLFVLIGLLAVAPFLALVVNGASKTLQRIFMAMGIGWLAVSLLARDTGVGLYWSFLFSGYCFPFMAGRFIEDLLRGCKSWALLLAALACSAANAYLDLTGLTGGIYAETPFYILAGLLYFVVLVRLGERLREGSLVQRAIAFAARHSFTVYLVHYMVLDWLLVHGFPNPAGLRSLVVQPVFALVILVVSLAIAAAVDTLVIQPVSRRLLKRI